VQRVSWKLAFNNRHGLEDVYIYRHINIKIGYDKIGEVPFL